MLRLFGLVNEWEDKVDDGEVWYEENKWTSSHLRPCLGCNSCSPLTGNLNTFLLPTVLRLVLPISGMTSYGGVRIFHADHEHIRGQ